MAKYGYYINLDERGEFFADVRSVTGESVYEIHGFDVFEDGFMRNKNDISGLMEMLVSHGVVQPSDKILSSTDFEYGKDIEQIIESGYFSSEKNNSFSQEVRAHATSEEYLSARAIMAKFMSVSQLKSVDELSTGEEGQFFIDTLVSLANIVNTMPKTMEQDESGDAAIAYLHYFKSDANFYITEKDVGDSVMSDFDQHQAFGLANIGHGAELGYISIAELIKNNVELDFYFKPVSIASLQSPDEPRLFIADEEQHKAPVSIMVDAATAAGGEKIDVKDHGAVVFVNFTLGDNAVLLSKKNDAYRVSWLVDGERKFTRYCADPAYAIDEYRQGYDAANDDDHDAGPGH